MAKALVKNITHLWYRRKHPLTNPYFMWKIILGITAVLLVSLLIWSYQLFLSVQKGEFFSGEGAPGESIDVLDYEVLENVIGHYDAKAKRFEDLKTEPVRFIDPSL